MRSKRFLAVMWLFAGGPLRERGGRQLVQRAHIRPFGAETALNERALRAGGHGPCVADLEIDPRDPEFRGLYTERGRTNVAVLKGVCPADLDEIPKMRWDASLRITDAELDPAWAPTFVGRFPVNASKGPQVDSGVVRVRCRIRTQDVKNDVGAARTKHCTEVGMWARYLANQLAPHVRWYSKVVFKRVRPRDPSAITTLIEPILLRADGSIISLEGTTPH